MRNLMILGAMAILATACARQEDEVYGYTNDEIIAQQQRLAEAERRGVDPAQLEPARVDTGASNPAVVVAPRQTGVSNSQDFDATVERESIESDAARIAALKGNYTVVAPTALPQRGDTVNLAAYALEQKQPVGARIYPRSVGNRITSGASCSRYRNNPDAAQVAFLKAGGPQSDRRSLDSDGDGFACGWTPEKYRNLLQ